MSDQYSKIINEHGQLINYEHARELGLDPTRAHEVIEQMYGMIWWLANSLSDEGWKFSAAYLVDEARKAYKEGLHVNSPGKEKES